MLSVQDLSLDLRTRRAKVVDRTVDLTAREFVLLELFLRHPAQVLSREQILSHVRGYDFDPGSNIVDVYVRALRRKLGAERIGAVRGMGYRLGRTGSRHMVAPWDPPPLPPVCRCGSTCWSASPRLS